MAENEKINEENAEQKIEESAGQPEPAKNVEATGAVDVNEKANEILSEAGFDLKEEEKKPQFEQLEEGEDISSKGLDLLMDVVLDVSIELGRTTMSVKDILALGVGSVVELDKMVGDPVDILVNNKLIAKGEVVVVDENFGVRITSIVTTEERLGTLE